MGALRGAFVVSGVAHTRCIAYTESMTENKDHRAPLAPGEIRAHRVGAQTFRVMHTGNGMYTQATVRGNGQPGRVLCTDMNERVAVAAYADAIEQAESDAIDALDDADATLFIGADTGRLINEIASYNLPDGADMTLVTGELWRTGHGLGPMPTVRPEDGTPAELLAIIRNDLRRYVPGDEQFLDRYLAAVREQLRERIEAYGEAVARGAMHLTMNSESASGARYAAQADAIKTDILKRFGGEHVSRHAANGGGR